ncbi:nSTAND3 domain-containing NTPase [Undibacterium umbellatum]|uniref:Novel STAND NTPase 3 domain-containing protein n=1 Tax=Undibacterium umbellatum TaxID=2762300 RepID=A0ABR6Z2I3_9BURK|nr:hypothetical protein [Undibacterium umbellatum]MBC3905940.1 hypothetical protein [Undibacterium umbellatum]
MFGNIQTNLIGYNSSIAENGFYLVDRTQLNHAEDALISGHDVILTSDVGNGKSIAAEQLSLRMTALGWRVFRVTADTKEVRKEAIQLLDAGGNIALVIDNYIPFLDLIDHFSVRRQGKNFKFILTCRSYVHDAFADRLEKRLYSTNITEIDVNRLGEDDNQKLIRMIDSFGLWSDFSAHSHQQKQNFLTNECNNQLHQVLLRLYAAPQMSERINRLFEDITPQVRRLVVAAMILNLSGLLVLKETLDDLLNNSPLMHLTNTDKESVKFIWSDVAGQIKLKSSALAEHYLKNLANSGEVVGIIIEMFDSAHEIYESRIYKRPTSEQFMRSIMSFSTLQKMIPENGFRPATIRFYEAIQTKTFVRKNPHFWLQYAIARLSFEDSLTEIETYFQSAYKHAEEINYDPFQIDNHYARLLLIRAIKEPFSVTTFSNYSKAKSIVMNQVALGATRKHYPYRVATLVLDLVKIHGEKFDQKQIKDFALFCGDILTRIEKSNQSIREHKHTIFCKKAMSDTLRELESYTPK